MIEFNKVCFNFEDEILLDSFSKVIQTGKKVAITGASGSGKTTLLNLLLGFLIPSSGKIFYDEIELKAENINKIRQKISYLPQDFNVPFDSVKNMFMSVFNLKTNSKLIPTTSEISEIFNSLGLENQIIDKKLDEISGGQKQRVLLSSILLLKKDFIFLDEPTSALDENSTKLLIKQLHLLKNTTVIAATHDKFFVDSADFVIDL